MQLSQIMASQAIRYVTTEDTQYERQSPVPFIRQFEDRYGFAQVPHTLEELNLKTGVSFLRGYFRGKIIDKLQLYENGLLCEAKENNSVCDDFLNDVFDWLPKQLNRVLKQGEPRAYLSQVEVTSEIDLASTFGKLSSAGGLISDLLNAYGQKTDTYIVNGFKMHYDVEGKPLPRGLEFIFERRAGELYSKNTYFSSAPLRTDDHLNVLEKIEAIFA